MTATVKIVQTRADQLEPGDVCRPLEWENRRPVFKQVAEVKPIGDDLLGFYWEPRSDYPERFHLYDLFQLQVLEATRVTPGRTPVSG